MPTEPTARHCGNRRPATARVPRRLTGEAEDARRLVRRRRRGQASASRTIGTDATFAAEGADGGRRRSAPSRDRGTCRTRPADTIGRDRDEGGTSDLTRREQEVLALVAEGPTNRQIADALFISESTAGVHVSNIVGKLGVAGRLEAATLAHRTGLLDQ
jgi:DNA-binding NarL/FixJ family response regulator